MNLQTLIEDLKTSGYKVTPQRKAILKVLLLNENTMLSVEEILERSKQIYDKINISTVYRNIEILEDLNLLCIVSGDDDLNLYKLISSNEHHHHLVCKICGKSELIQFCPIEIFEQLSKEKGFHLTDHKLELYGYCKDCEKNK